MLSKINVFGIIGNHIKTLKYYGSTKLSHWEIFLHLGVPLIIGIFLGIHCPLAEQSLSILITVYSILIGFFLSIIALLFTFVEKLEDERTKVAASTNSTINDNKTIEWREDLVVEIFANLSYAILMALISISVLVLMYVKPGLSAFMNRFPNTIQQYVPYVGIASNILSWMLLANQGLVIFMVLKRMHVLFNDQIKDIKKIPLQDI